MEHQWGIRGASVGHPWGIRGRLHLKEHLARPADVASVGQRLRPRCADRLAIVRLQREGNVRVD